MGLAADVTDRIYIHALRSGAARDVVHVQMFDRIVMGIPANDLDVIRRSIGHAPMAFDAGTTNDCVGEPDTDYLLVCSRARVVHNREPEIVAGESKLEGRNTGRIPAKKVQAWDEIGSASLRFFAWRGAFPQRDLRCVRTEQVEIGHSEDATIKQR